MAITIKLTKKLDKKELVKTVCSHGWMLPFVQTECSLNEDPQTSKKVRQYTFVARHLMIIYQPILDELTIIGPSAEIEESAKIDIPEILEKNKLGTVINDKFHYLCVLEQYRPILENKDMAKLIEEVESKDLRYNSQYV